MTKKCGYDGCRAPINKGRVCLVCTKGNTCPKCGRCVYCSGDFAKIRPVRRKS